MMASGEPEDMDLDALRLAALATFKKRSSELEDKLSIRRGKDDEDLDQLRKVALQSKKGPDGIPEQPAQKRPQTNKSSNFFGGFYRDKAYGRNSNLIVIKTIPLEESNNKDSILPEKKTLLKPQDRFCHLTDEDVSSSPQPQRWKATGKFSRFDSSSSDSEDSDDFDFTENRTDSQSSDENGGKDTEKDENHSSSEFSEDELQICDESCDQFMDVADDSPQTESCTTVNGSATDANKIPRIDIYKHCVTNDGKDNNVESHGKKDPTRKDSSESEKNGSQEKKYKSIRRNQHSRETRSNLRHTDGALSESSKRRDASVSNSKDRQRRKEKTRTSVDVRGGERQTRSRRNPKSILGNMDVDPEKLEARRRKFFDSEKAPVAPKDGKISLRGIVAKSKTRTSSNSKKSHSSHDSTKLPRTSVKSTVSVTPDFGGKENSRKSERMQTNIDGDQDLRLLLRRPDAKSPTSPQSEQLKPRRTKNSGRNPVIKSVLSLVKVDGRSSVAAISSGNDHPAVHPATTTTEQMQTSPSPEPSSKSKRRKVVPDSPLRKRRTKDCCGSEKRRRVTVLDDDESQGDCCERLNIIIQKDSQPAISHAKSKVPIHLRLGQQISTPSTAQSSDESTSPSRAVHLQTQTCEDTQEMGSSSQVRPSRSASGIGADANPLDVPSSSAASTESSSGQLPPSSDVSGIECESALDAKIRKIQERNEAILRRQEEVVADKLLYG